MGDFNINVRGGDESYIFAGRIPKGPKVKGGDDVFLVDTRYDESERRFLWSRCARPGKRPSGPSGAGDPVASLALRDVYGDINRLAEDDEGRLVGTSHNVDRLE